MRVLGLGGFEWLIILLVVILIFGTSRLANVGPALGKSVRGFRRELKGEDETKPTETKQNSTTNAPASKSDDGKASWF